MCSTIFRKFFLSKMYNKQSETVIIEPERGASCNNANSPKLSPM